DGLFLDIVQFLAAEIVLASLHQRDAHLWEQFLEKGNVFVKELLLKIFGSRGDHGSQTAAQQRHKVRQRLACPGARLHNKVLAIFQRRLYTLRHLELPRPEFVIRMVARQPPPRSEDFIERELVRRLLVGRHRKRSAVAISSAELKFGATHSAIMPLNCDPGKAVAGAAVD